MEQEEKTEEIETKFFFQQGCSNEGVLVARTKKAEEELQWAEQHRQRERKRAPILKRKRARDTSP
jgi:hypothetical protein